MDQIKEKTAELIHSIRQSDTYVKYVDALQKVEAHQEWKDVMNQFRSNLFHMHNGNDEIDLFDETDRMEQRYQELQKVPEITAYLEAELDLCRLIKAIELQINGEIELHLPE